MREQPCPGPFLGVTTQRLILSRNFTYAAASWQAPEACSPAFREPARLHSLSMQIHVSTTDRFDASSAVSDTAVIYINIGPVLESSHRLLNLA